MLTINCLGQNVGSRKKDYLVPNGNSKLWYLRQDIDDITGP